MYQSVLLIEGNNFKIDQVTDGRQYVKEGSAHNRLQQTLVVFWE